MHFSTQVLNIPELLTMVLRYLPAEDLLFQQRVNKTWQGLIKRTPNLQRKLFLCADVWDMSDGFPALEWNPFLSRLREKVPAWKYQEEPSYWTRVSAKVLEAYNHPTASWKNMFLTQPASCDIYALIYSKHGCVLAMAPKSKTGWTLGKITKRKDWLVCDTIGPQVQTLSEVPDPLDEIRLLLA